MLGVGQCSADELYRALDWRHDAQPASERRLARQPRVSRARPFARRPSASIRGIVFGLVCSALGCPIAVEVFWGNTADPANVAAQVSKRKDRFGIQHLASVGDCGMLTSARIVRPGSTEENWINAVRWAAERRATS